MTVMSLPEIRKVLLGETEADLEAHPLRSSSKAVGHRLRAALAYRGWNVSEFIRRLRASKCEIRGATAVFEYVNGHKCPPIPFFEAASRVLGVRPAWLAFGDDRPSSGPPVTVSQKLRILADELQGVN